MREQILYFFDPLCGWCYGFSDTIYQFAEKTKTTYEFVPIPGGMVIDDRIAPYSTMHEYIVGAYENVQNMTGCIFGDEYLNTLLPSTEKVMDSEPPSRAVVTFRTFLPEQCMDFVKDMQYEHYYKGKDYGDSSWFTDLAAKYGVDKTMFEDRFSEKKMKQQVQMEFAWVRESGIQGYPTVVLRKGQKYYLLTNGFATLESLEHSLLRAEKMLS